jgi:hypothetical protein
VLRRARIRRVRGGTIRIDLPDHERELLQRVLPQLRELLTADESDERTRRLFPVAFPDDTEAEGEYQRYMHSELVTSRLSALDAVESTVTAKELTEEQAVAWMQSINSVRLVLGSLLDVSEELELDNLPADHPQIETYALYAYLSMLLGELVDALSR